MEPSKYQNTRNFGTDYWYSSNMMTTRFVTLLNFNVFNSQVFRQCRQNRRTSSVVPK